MRKLVLVLLTLALPAISHARDSAEGCGLGWEITSKASWAGSSTRMTTNAFVPPTFGMTSGTLGCTRFSIVKNEEREAVTYVVNNYSNLKETLATGQGEYVEALSEVMGCGAAFGAKVQSDYDAVVAPTADGLELYQSLKGVCKG